MPSTAHTGRRRPHGDHRPGGSISGRSIACTSIRQAACGCLPRQRRPIWNSPLASSITTSLCSSKCSAGRAPSPTSSWTRRSRFPGPASTRVRRSARCCPASSASCRCGARRWPASRMTSPPSGTTASRRCARGWRALATDFAAYVHGVCADDRFGETFVDATGEEPYVFTAAGMIAHVLTYAAFRRTLVVSALAAAGCEIEDDPLSWFNP